MLLCIHIVCSFSDSEVVEFSMSDLEQRDPLSSYTQSETLAPSYDSQSSLSSQLLVLSQTQQTVPEEEEPVSEQSFPYGVSSSWYMYT